MILPFEFSAGSFAAFRFKGRRGGNALAPDQQDMQPDKNADDHRQYDDMKGKVPGKRNSRDKFSTAHIRGDPFADNRQEGRNCRGDGGLPEACLVPGQQLSGNTCQEHQKEHDTAGNPGDLSGPFIADP